VSEVQRKACSIAGGTVNDTLIIIVVPLLFLFLFIGLPLIIILSIRKRNNYPIQNDIQPYLAADETLLECTHVSIGADGVLPNSMGQTSVEFAALAGDWYYAGLTDKRLLLVADGHRNKTFSFPLADGLALEYAREEAWVSDIVPGFLYVRLRGVTLVLKAQGKKWWQRAERLVVLFKRMYLR
jgi:hypothetical protein